MEQWVKQQYQNIDWRTLPALADWVVEAGIRIQQIPAPTFHEEQRAAYLARQFAQFGLDDIRTDDAKNVYGVYTGLNRTLPALMVVAHTDTVFQMDTDLSIQRDGNTIYGVGLGDNSMGVAGLLGLLKWMVDNGYQPACDVWFVATSCEEGLGDLKGIRAAYDALKPAIGAIINLEGLAFGHIYHAGIAVHRMHIRATADGGHSWLHFGRPSAVHGILELGAQISRIVPPTSPRTTYNIGMIDGGQAINAIGTSASLWLDLRSEEQEALDRIRQQVHDIIDGIQRPGLRFDVEVVGNRPAGAIDCKHPLVRGSLAALDQVGVRGSLETGSTDGNIPLAHGCPTVTIGITRGGNAHRLDEYIEVSPVSSGMKQFITLATATMRYLQDEYEKAAGD